MKPDFDKIAAETLEKYEKFGASGCGSLAQLIAAKLAEQHRAGLGRAAEIVDAKRGSVPSWKQADIDKINQYPAHEASRATSSELLSQLDANIRAEMEKVQ